MQISLPRSLFVAASATVLFGAFVLALPARAQVTEQTPTEKDEPAEFEFDTDSTEDPGQTDLDEAAVLRFDAKTPRELQTVERLLQSSIKKGLKGENASFAKKMLGSVSLRPAVGFSGAI
ncbi:MAG: hypothetical protein AAFX06_24755, partial [Planctomycetota bacterium]